MGLWAFLGVGSGPVRNGEKGAKADKCKEKYKNSLNKSKSVEITLQGVCPKSHDVTPLSP